MDETATVIGEITWPYTRHVTYNYVLKSSHMLYEL